MQLEVKKLMYTVENEELGFEDFKLFGTASAIDQERGRRVHPQHFVRQCAMMGVVARSMAVV